MSFFPFKEKYFILVKYYFAGTAQSDITN